MKHTAGSPVHYIPVSFLIAIAMGTLLLMLPVSSAPGESTGFLTALFTATTSICVTGLVVVDTCAHWSVFGQFIILLLIQIGGLGVVAVGSMIMLLSRRKFMLWDRMLLGDSLNVDKRRGILRFLTSMFKGVFVVEAAGTVLCAVKLVPMLGLQKGLWALLMCTTMMLIIMGGIGFVVWFDLIEGIKNGIKNRYKPATVFSHLPEHTRLVILMTLFLIIAGAVWIFAAEYNNPDTLGNMDMPVKILNSLFQSVTFRTAGFASVPQEKLTEISCMAGYVLMFIGGSPVGTAGGIKTVTAFLFFANAFSYISGKKEDLVFHRRIPEEMLKKAAAIVFFSFIAVLVMTVLLMSRGGILLTDAFYEVVSAMGTVGLSRALTPTLDNPGRVIIIISMYLGRIGPISMAVFFAKQSGAENTLKHAEGRFYVG